MNRLVKFGTIEYYKAYADALNKDADFGKGGITSSMMYIFTDVTGPDGQPKAFLLKFDSGKVAASEAKASDLSQAEFGQTGTYALLASIAKGEVSSQKAKLKLNMMKAMKNQGTLKRLTEVSKALPGVEY